MKPVRPLRFSCPERGGTSEVSGTEILSFQEIYELYADAVYRVCFFLLKRKEDTEDAVQTVFLRLFTKAPEFREEEHRKAWLLRTASNLCKDMLRSRRFVSEEPEQLEIHAEQAGGTVCAAEDETLELLMTLSEEYKMPLYLFYYEKYTCEEIAVILGKKPSTVRSLLFRGRGKLKQLLEGETV